MAVIQNDISRRGLIDGVILQRRGNNTVIKDAGYLPKYFPGFASISNNLAELNRYISNRWNLLSNSEKSLWDVYSQDPSLFITTRHPNTCPRSGYLAFMQLNSNILTFFYLQAPVSYTIFDSNYTPGIIDCTVNYSPKFITVPPITPLNTQFIVLNKYPPYNPIVKDIGFFGNDLFASANQIQFYIGCDILARLVNFTGIQNVNNEDIYFKFYLSNPLPNYWYVPSNYFDQLLIQFGKSDYVSGIINSNNWSYNIYQFRFEDMYNYRSIQLYKYYFITGFLLNSKGQQALWFQYPIQFY